MQEVYTREGLEENAYHPLHLGLMNYFARWTSAPLFRMWWPLLKTMYPQPFTRFVERQFGVRPPTGPGGSMDGIPGNLSRELEGFAMSAWRQQHPEALAPDRYFLPYLMRLRYLGGTYAVQAAQVVVAWEEGHLAWNVEDFYVPPGLWGVGIGQNFLRSLRSEPPEGMSPDGCFFVRLRVTSGAGASAKKRIANEVQLYRSAGFSEVAHGDVPLAVRRALAFEASPGTAGNPVSPREPQPEGGGALGDGPGDARPESDGVRWMVAAPTSPRTPSKAPSKGTTDPRA